MITQSQFMILLIVVLFIIVVILEIKSKGWKEGLIYLVCMIVANGILFSIIFFIMSKLPKG